MSSTQYVTQHPNPTNTNATQANAESQTTNNNSNTVDVVSSATTEQTPLVDAQAVPEIASFDDLNLHESLLRGIYAYGFEVPSTIQRKAIPKLLTGRDTIAQAQSGTGKTATFSIAILQSIEPTAQETQAIVLEPTRELAEQTANVLKAFAAPRMHDVTVQLLIGGRRTGLDKKALQNGPQVVVGTPGRVMHMIREGYLRMEKCSFFCLDEADQMLSFGFKDQVYDIFQYVPEQAQVALVSATMPIEVLQLTEKFMREPHRILLEKEEVALEGIQQFEIALDSDSQKYSTLCDVFSLLTVSSSIIFCNTRRQVERLHEAMKEDKFPVSKIHGEMAQEERDLALAEFRMGATRVLISTDVLAKGIDVQSVGVVVNYNLPREREFYIHRIGRAGRFGRRGVAISLATIQDLKFLRGIESHYHTVIEPMPMSLHNDPTGFIGA